MRADLDWRFRVASLVLPRLICFQNDNEWMSIARKAENRETQAASESPELAGRSCALRNYLYIVVMKIHCMSLPKKNQELGICQLLVSSTEATFVVFVGLIKYA